MLNTLRRWAMIPMLRAMVFMMPPARAPAPWELPTEIQAQLVADVRIKLLQHYQTEAIAEADGRFDFRSCKHAAIAGGLVQVRGDFLLSEQTVAAHTGSVEVFYAANDSGRSVLERYCVEERSVPLHTLVVQVRDGLSGEPLAGATVVARSGLRHSSQVHTSAQGEAQLDLLQGTFQIFVNHPRYHSRVTPHVEVRAAQQAKDIFLVPITPP